MFCCAAEWRGNHGKGRPPGSCDLHVRTASSRPPGGWLLFSRSALGAQGLGVFTVVFCCLQRQLQLVWCSS